MKSKVKLLIILFSISMMACSHLNYYAQAINGQLDITRRAQPITDLLNNAAIPNNLKQRLSQVAKIRAFATHELHLPDNLSYTYYADIERPFVVWSVFATPEFSLEPKRWCFFIIGCVSYRGYFSQESANALAKELRDQHYDVYVAGIPAYSTLGWFDDPILNTVLHWPTPHLAGLIFHELTHQLLYIPNDTAFNEAFAVTIQEIGVQRWLITQGTVQQWADYKTHQRREIELKQLFLSSRKQLHELYSKNFSYTEISVRKTEIFENLRKNYEKLKTQWQGYNGYDEWFAKDLNNAKLLSIMTYHELVPAFHYLLEQNEGDLLKFYKYVKQLGELPKEQRQAHLQQLLSLSSSFNHH